MNDNLVPNDLLPGNKIPQERSKGDKTGQNHSCQDQNDGEDQIVVSIIETLLYLSSTCEKLRREKERQ